MKIIHLKLLLVLMLGLMSTFGYAAESKTVVKVALLDMSSVTPANMAAYYNMMGPGANSGMMVPGWTPPMMGYGMMQGMMSIRVDQSTVKAGTITFDVSNWSRATLHEMLIISVASSSTPLPYDYAQARVPEDQVKIVGEVSDMAPNASKTIDVTLAPGAYLLICNTPGHYAAGMAVPVTVTQ